MKKLQLWFSLNQQLVAGICFFILALFALAFLSIGWIIGFGAFGLIYLGSYLGSLIE